MLLRVELYGELPEAWSDYMNENPDISVVSPDPLILKLSGPDKDVAGVLSALGHLRVPARAVYLERVRSRRNPKRVLAPSTNG